MIYTRIFLSAQNTYPDFIILKRIIDIDIDNSSAIFSSGICRETRMAEDFSVLKDLQSHLRTAQVPIDQLSTLAQQGDDKVYVYKAGLSHLITALLTT